MSSSLRYQSWKDYYALERSELGEAGLSALFDDAPKVVLRARGAIVFPHTLLRASGKFTAAAARAVIDSGADRVLAIGVRHGARDGGKEARGIFEDVEGEFSLDNFGVLLELAARRVGRPAPQLLRRFPFLVGDDPTTLPGFDELARTAEQCALVGTTDPIHYGIGYGDRAAPFDHQSEEARRWAREEIEFAFSALAEHDFDPFLEHAARVRSDFRDAGPTLAALLKNAFRFSIKALELVDYADVLGAPRPTWVAGALVECTAPRTR